MFMLGLSLSSTDLSRQLRRQVQRCRTHPTPNSSHDWTERITTDAFSYG
jgi:hypothetical protein